MATFLELVRDVARESGTLAGGIALPTVANPTARADKLISWTRKAWVNLQNDRQDWPWMIREFSYAIAISDNRYTPADLGITRFSVWRGDRPRFPTFTLYDPAIGKKDEGAIHQVDYDTWRFQYGRGAPDPNRPIIWAISPMNEIVLGPTPDKAYILSGEYRVAPQVLAIDTDVPELPEQYHNAIVCEALKLLGFGDESPTSQTAISEYVLAHQNLMRDFLPEIMLGGDPVA